MSAIPTKMIPSAMTIGVDSLKALTPERIHLKPVNQALSYTKAGINKITFRIPAYSNSFLDTSKTFLTYNLSYNSSTTISVGNNCAPVNTANFISRVVVRTSAGLVIDDISDYHVLNQMNQAMLPTCKTINAIEGRLAASMDTGVHSPEYTVAKAFRDTGIEFRHHFQAGLFSSHTEKLLPIGAMDGGSGFCFEIDLYLADDPAVMKETGIVNAPFYEVKDVIMHLETIRADESLCQKFNQIACDGDKEILIPFTTMHAHQSYLQSRGQNIIRIHESATNLKRIFSVYLANNDVTIKNSTEAYKFLGGSADPAKKVLRYNVRVGSKWLYNDYVEGTAESVMHLKNSLGMQNTPLVLETANSGFITYADVSKMIHVVDFGYTNEKFLDGISSNTPIEFYVDMSTIYSLNTSIMHSFTELNYNLSIRKGQVSYVEPKPGVGTVY
jgi:hypothetical protein